MVEPRLEQAAEAVEPRLEQAAEAVEPRLPAAGRSGTGPEAARSRPAKAVMAKGGGNQDTALEGQNQNGYAHSLIEQC